MTVKIKYGDFQQITRSRSHAHPIDSKHLLRETSLMLIRSIFPPVKGVRLVGVTVSNFTAREADGIQELPLPLPAQWRLSSGGRP